MSAPRWLREDSPDEWRIDRIDPCEAGTCAHSEHGGRSVTTSKIGDTSTETATEQPLRDAPLPSTRSE